MTCRKLRRAISEGRGRSSQPACRRIVTSEHIRERIYLDKADRNILHDDITVLDHALTQPWMPHKKIAPVNAARPVWRSGLCEEDNALVRIGKNGYFLSADGYLKPTKKGQAPPDLGYFKQSQK
jgi:hypothetical protein